jgi:acyl-CoA thioester hydrolase
MKVRIYYHDTDCGKVVYYANYLKFLEEARTQFMEEKGIFIKDLIKQGVLFVVARQEIDYKSPAFYGDVLDIQTRLENLSGVKMVFSYDIKNQEEKLVSCAKTTLVCVDKDFRPQEIPQRLRRALGGDG